MVIPSVGPQARRRGIALVPTERPLYQDECDSSPPHLRCSARNDCQSLWHALGMTGLSGQDVESRELEMLVERQRLPNAA